MTVLGFVLVPAVLAVCYLAHALEEVVLGRLAARGVPMPEPHRSEVVW